jgi:hypothetical protein
LKANGLERYRALEYAWDRFETSERVDDGVRRRFRSSASLRDAMGPDPFQSARILADPCEEEAASGVAPTHAMLAYRDAHPEVRQAFPMGSRESIVRYGRWFSEDRGALEAFGASLIELHRRSWGREASEGVTATFAAETVPRGYRGLYEPEADVRELGLWVSEVLLVPAAAVPGARLRLEGRYDRSSIARRWGDDVHATLRFFAGDASIGDATLADDGAFEVQLDIPSSYRGDLRITSDRAFVPRDIGINQEARSLSWRLVRLAVGNAVPIDCRRHPIFGNA